MSNKALSDLLLRWFVPALMFLTLVLASTDLLAQEADPATGDDTEEVATDPSAEGEDTAVGEADGEGEGDGDTEDPATGVPPPREIIFLRPPDNPIVGRTSTNSDILSLIDNVEIRDALREANFSFTRKGLGADYQLSLNGGALSLPDTLLRRIPGNTELLQNVNAVSATTLVSLNKAFDMESVETGELLVESVRVESLSLDWAGLILTGSGDFDVDGFGRLNGEATLTVSDWQGAFNLSQLIGVTAASQLEPLLSILTGDAEFTVPVIVKDSVASIGGNQVGIIPPVLFQ